MIGDYFWGFLDKAIYGTLVNQENVQISKPFSVTFDFLCVFIMQVLFLSARRTNKPQLRFICSGLGLGLINSVVLSQ